MKSENFEQESLWDESMSLINLHLPSSFGGAMLIVAILGQACLGYGAARLPDCQKDAARRAATTLEIAKSPV